MASKWVPDGLEPEKVLARPLWEWVATIRPSHEALCQSGPCRRFGTAMMDGFAVIWNPADW